LTIRPAKAIKKHDFQKTVDPASRSTDTNAIIEAKRSIIAFMAKSGKKKREGPSCCCRMKEGRAFQGTIEFNQWPGLQRLGRPEKNKEAIIWAFPIRKDSK